MDKIINNTYPEPNTGCWLWAGAVNRGGYATSYFGRGVSRFVHRFMYAQNNGDFDKSLVVCHKCDVRCCVNPDHLFLGTRTDNNHDMYSKGRHNKGSDRPASKLSENEVLAIRALSSTVSTYKISKEFGVSQTTVFRIIKRVIWKHI